MLKRSSLTYVWACVVAGCSMGRKMSLAGLNESIIRGEELAENDMLRDFLPVPLWYPSSNWLQLLSLYRWPEDSTESTLGYPHILVVESGVASLGLNEQELKPESGDTDDERGTSDIVVEDGSSAWLGDGIRIFSPILLINPSMPSMPPMFLAIIAMNSANGFAWLLSPRGTGKGSCERSESEVLASAGFIALRVCR